MTNDFICSLNELNNATINYNKTLDHHAYVASSNSLFTIKGCAMHKKILNVTKEYISFNQPNNLYAKSIKSLPYNQGNICLSVNHY